MEVKTARGYRIKVPVGTDNETVSCAIKYILSGSVELPDRSGDLMEYKTFRLDGDDLANLQALCESKGISITEAVKIAILGKEIGG